MATGYKRPLDEGYALPPEAKRPATDPGASVGRVSNETVLRILMPARKVGALIGKSGQIVKQIRDETGTRIRVCEGVPGCDDRVIIVSGREHDLSKPINSAQSALLKVHAKAVEGDEAFVPPGGDLPVLQARLLVCHTQAGSIIGKGGEIIKGIRDATGAKINILPVEELPTCGLANDRVVLLNGDGPALELALEMVTKQIRENPPKERPGGAPPTLISFLMPSNPMGDQPPGGAASYPGPPPQQSIHRPATYSSAPQTYQ